MPIVACPHCGTKLDAPETVLGKEVVCGQCSNRFIAVAMEAAEAGAGPPQPEVPTPAGEFGEPLGPETMPSEMPSQPPPEAGGPPSAVSPPEPSPPAPAIPPPGAVPPPPGPAAPGRIPPAPVPPPPGAFGAPHPQPQAPKPSGNATAALTLGIISLVCGCCCWPAGLICGILAIVFGNRAVGDIQAGLADPDSAGKARAGKICGIIGLILSIVGAVISIINLAAGGGPFGQPFDLDW